MLILFPRELVQLRLSRQLVQQRPRQLMPPLLIAQLGFPIDHVTLAVFATGRF